MNILRAVAATVAIGALPLVMAVNPAEAASPPPTPAGLTLSVTSAVLPLTGGSLTAQLGLQSSTAEQVTVSPATVTLTPSGAVTCATRPDPAWTLRITPGKTSYPVAPRTPMILSVAITHQPGTALSPGTHLVGIAASTQKTGIRQAACSYFRVTDPTAVASSRVVAAPHRTSIVATLVVVTLIVTALGAAAVAAFFRFGTSSRRNTHPA